MTDKPKVLLMQPPIYDFALYDLFLKPYGLLRVGMWLQESSYDVSYLNALDWRDSRTAAVYGPVKRKRNGTGKFFRQPAELPEGIVRIPKQYSRYGVLPESISAGIEAAMASAKMGVSTLLVTMDKNAMSSPGKERNFP